jgi:hypothetical protein
MAFRLLTAPTSFVDVVGVTVQSIGSSHDDFQAIEAVTVLIWPRADSQHGSHGFTIQALQKGPLEIRGIVECS